MLLEAGANVHSSDKYELTVSLQEISYDTIKLLIAYGVDFSVLNDVKN